VEAVKALANYVAVSSALTEINLYWNDIGPAGGIAMADALSVNATLTTLNLSSTNLIGATGYVEASRLRHQVFAKSPGEFRVDDKVVFEGREMIVLEGKDWKGNVKMKPLDWAAGITAIGEALRVDGAVTALKFLDLGSNPIGDKGAIAIARGARAQGKLETLILQSCGIGASGAEALGEYVRASEALTKLDLNFNQIGDGARDTLSQIRKPGLVLELDGQCPLVSPRRR
jgi:hypothetical protein